MLPLSLADRLSYLLGNLYRRSIELETEELGRLGIGVKQQAALAVIADEGPMTQQQLGRRLGVDRTTVVTLVDELAGAGLLERARNPADRRSHLVSLTEAGRSRQAQGREHVRGAEARLLDTLDEQQRRTLVALLAKALYPNGSQDGDRA